MLCNKCKIIEMKVDKVVDEVMHFRCKQCGNEVEKTIEEVEKENKEDK